MPAYPIQTIRWERYLPASRPCRVCSTPTVCEYVLTLQAHPGDMAAWEPLCFTHRRADTLRLLLGIHDGRCLGKCFSLWPQARG